MTLQEASEASRARLGSPILGTYTTYLAVLHWKVFVVLFSGGTATEKIHASEKILSCVFWTNLIGAFLLTILTLIFMPIAKGYYDKYVSDKDSSVQKHINQNNRNVVRENAEATDIIRELVSRNVQLNEIDNLAKTLLEECRKWSEVRGIKSNSYSDLKNTIESSLTEIIKRNNIVHSSLHTLATDAKDLI